MRGSNICSGLLSEKIENVKSWIKDMLSRARLSAQPSGFTVVAGKEKPQVGEPFDVLWVKFEFDDGMWDDEVMWDIRYLLMGSKLNKLRGFPLELEDIREKLYISRDGISERRRSSGSG